MTYNANCYNCEKPLSEGMFTKDGKIFNEYYCSNDACSEMFRQVVVLPAKATD